MVQGGKVGVALKGKRLRRAALAALMLTSSLGMVGMAAPAQAQEAARDFDIPAQPLANALTAFGQQSGLQVSAQAPLVEGRTSSAVRDALPPLQALSQLLTGTGLSFRIVGSTVTLEPAPQSGDGAIQLGPVRVEGEGNGVSAGYNDLAVPTSPVEGYVAKRAGVGTKTGTSLLEIPQSISVVTREQMDDQAVQNLSEALRYTSGVRTDAGGAQAAANNFFVRGFNSQGKTVLDGLRLQPTGYFGFFAEEPYGLERVEVLKGPSSMLYGQSTVPGGLVALVSKRPTEEKRGEIELATGTQNRIQGAADVSGPINSDGSLLFRFVALARDADSTVDYWKDSRIYVAPSLIWKPGARTSLTLLPSYQKNWASYTTNIPYAALDGSSPYGRVPMSRFLGEPDFDRETTEVWSLGYEFAHEFHDNWRFQQNFRYTNFDNHENYLARGSGLIDGTNINRYFSLRHAYGNNMAIDNYLQGQFLTGPISHTILAGLDHTDGTAKRWEATGSPVYSINVFNPSYGTVIDTSVYSNETNTTQRGIQTGIYIQDQLRWDRLIATLTVRHDWASSKVTNRMTGLVTSDRDWTATTFRGGFNYVFDSGIAPYISYSESFNPATGTTSPARGSTPFEPERGVQKEIGVKFQPDGAKISVTLSVFDLRRQNVSTLDPDNTSYSVQTGEVRARGVEFEAVGELTRNLKIIGAFSYVDVETTKDNTASNIGKHPARAPAYLGSLWVDYRFPHGTLDGLELGLGARYTGSSSGDAANTFEVPAYTLLDLALRYDLGKAGTALRGWNASLNVRNLADKYYVASCFLTAACNMGEGRTAVAKLTYKW